MDILEEHISYYYDNTTCFIIVYDVTNETSFKNVSHWLQKISSKINIKKVKCGLFTLTKISKGS